MKNDQNEIESFKTETILIVKMQHQTRRTDTMARQQQVKQAYRTAKMSESGNEFINDISAFKNSDSFHSAFFLQICFTCH
ncbi:hypothetical protein ACL9RI_05510 [Janthinobacterium sp. Mn2066]|uniref:hypothetical protein n=1 Tax=Janthinobacterium sp. Mn2066 TaxID=3395264 RepID=UPI003BE88F62